ncbi:MAG: Rpn family recombination-promoting nuclease/putative transposase, partial [Spirochaetales bacterium]|nr:Rpn family recombination-promoting nuclease/putative transposase [Spirochaetales bacterium]
EKWIYYLLNEGKEDPVMKILIKDDQDIAKAHEVYNHFTRDDKMRDAYEARQKWLKDYNSAIAEAEEKGIEKGMEKGIGIGVEKGMGQGVEKVALTMRKLGVSIEEISRFTGLSVDEINRLNQD